MRRHLKVAVAMQEKTRIRTDELGEADVNNENNILSSHANELISGKLKTTRVFDIKEGNQLWPIGT